jgi:hypothetical protein
MYDPHQNQEQAAQAGKQPCTRSDTQLDEYVWQAWLDKNREQDRVRFARRVKILKFISAILLLIAVLGALRKLS